MRYRTACWVRSDASAAETAREMVKSQPQKLEALIRAWIDEAVRDEVIPSDCRGRSEIVNDLRQTRCTDLDVGATEMAAD